MGGLAKLKCQIDIRHLHLTNVIAFKRPQMKADAITARTA